MSKVDEGAGPSQIGLCRSIFSNLVLCHSHLWHLVLLCRDAKRMDDAVYFSTLIFRKDAKSVSLGGGRFERHGGTSPYLTDTARLFFRLGLFLSKRLNASKAYVEDDFMYYLRKSYDGVALRRLGMRSHLVEAANCAVLVVGDYTRFHKAGYSLSFDEPSSSMSLVIDKDHYERRHNMLSRLAKRCVGIIEFLDSLEEQLGKAPPKP